MRETEVLFLGTTACLFDRDEDAPSFLVNGKYLFDTGWSLVSNLINNSIDPFHIKYLFFSHMHHDHYMGLPQLLFYILQKGGRLEGLHLIGPAKDVERITGYAMEFLEADKFWNTKGPKVVPLQEKDMVETEDMIFETCRAVHGVEGFCYRITDKGTDKVICYTGDTGYNEQLIQHFRDCDLLIHEVSLGLSDKRKEEEINAGHSTIHEAVSLANCVGAKKLLLVHHSKKGQEEMMAYVKEYFKGEAAGFPERGKRYQI